MRVDTIMTAEVKSCKANDCLATAAQIMWDNDCGVVPVVDDDTRVIGVLTDRDICMACWSHDAKPSALPVEGTMSRQVKACAPRDSVAAAEQIMEKNQIRRLPVVDGDGKLVGLLSLNDITREAKRELVGDAKQKAVPPESLVAALAAISMPRKQAQPRA